MSKYSLPPQQTRSQDEKDWEDLQNLEDDASEILSEMIESISRGSRALSIAYAAYMLFDGICASRPENEEKAFREAIPAWVENRKSVIKRARGH